jgi:hypothetical protein
MLRHFAFACVLASCGGEAGPASIVSIAAAELHGLWLNVDEDGTERVWVVAPRDELEPVFAGRGEVSTLCIDGAPVLWTTFEVAEGHIVETVLEDRGQANAAPGERFGTEILGYTGDTLTMESVSAPSGRRVWRRIPRYEPHEPSGWVRAEASRSHLPHDEAGVESPFPLGATSLAFDGDGDWHLVASQQPRTSMPGNSPSVGPGALYASRKNACATRTEAIAQFGGYTEILIDPDEAVILLPDNNFDSGQIGIRSRPVGDNLTHSDWQYRELEGASWIYNDGSALGPDGSLRFMRRDRLDGGEVIWTVGPDTTPPVPLLVADHWAVIFTSDRRACFLTLETWDTDLLLWCEQADGTFTSEAVTGTAWTGGPPPGSHALGPTPDGGVIVGSCFRGVELYVKDEGAWSRHRLTETPCTGLALAVDAQDRVHLRAEMNGRLEYLRWDGSTVLRELPSVSLNGREPWDEFGGDEPRIRLGPQGQVALVIGKARAVIRPADAELHRKTTPVTIQIEGEGELELSPQGAAPVRCTATCTLEAPMGLYLPFTTSTSNGWVHVDQDGRDGLLPIDQDAPTFRFSFQRSHVIGIARLEAGQRFERVTALPAGGHAVVTSLGDARRLGVMDLDGLHTTWRWSLELPSALQITHLAGLPGGELVAFGNIGAAFDLGLGPIANSTNFGTDAVVLHFDAEGRPTWAKQIPGPSSVDAIATLDEEVVFAFRTATSGTFEGHALTGTVHLARLVGHVVTEAKSYEGHIVSALAVSADRTFAAGQAFPFDGPGQTASLAAFDHTLDLLWTRVAVSDSYGIDHVALDATGRVHGYGRSRGGDYGGGELPNPAGPGQPYGAVHVILDADGGFVSAQGYPFFEVPTGLSADGDALRFVNPNADLVELASNRGTAPLHRLQTGVPSGRVDVIAANWTSADSGTQVFVNQSGFMDWVLEAFEHQGGVILDARF